MNSVAVPSPIVSLAAVIGALRGAVGSWGVRGLLSHALMMLLHRRLGEICGRMERLAARFHAGRVWRIRLRAGVARRPLDGAAAGTTRVWPGEFAWLVRRAAHEAAGFGSQLRAVLERAEMVELLEAVPQAGRMLRPLCRMLGVESSVLRLRRPVRSDAAVDVGTSERALEGTKRVRARRPEPEPWRIPLPRGVLSAARRQGFGKL